MSRSSSLRSAIITTRSSHRRASFLLAFVAGVVVMSSSALAGADLSGGWGDWWLPPVRSVHGSSIDSLFIVTFWIVMVAFAATEITLVVFLVRYRRRANRKKAYFTHGNTRLEMAWTLAPAVIFVALVIVNKGVWDRLRYNPDGNRPDKATILVIGQQFKWNVIYPGPDGKLGRYLIFPKPTDAYWPPMISPTTHKLKRIKFGGVQGPASLPYEQAVKQIDSYINAMNPLGKDFTDPDGFDDDWSPTPGREIDIPVNRPVEVQLGSKDVIHDFFLPNFRVKLDAVPGMRGKIVFTADMTSKKREQLSQRKYTVDDLIKILSRPTAPDLMIVIDKNSPKAIEDKHHAGNYLYVEDPAAEHPTTIIRNDQPLTTDRVEKLKALGVTDVVAHTSGAWDLICEELCGQGHYTMVGQVVVLDADEYNRRFEGGRSFGNTSKPSSVALAR